MDIAPGSQAVQSCHALRLFVHEHKEIELEWYNNSNYLALLSVNNESELIELLRMAHNKNIPASYFREPDMQNQITAIALAPGSKSKKLCSKLKLALR